MKVKADRERLVAGLGVVGGALIFTVFLDYLYKWGTVWIVNVSFVIIGALLVLAAVLVYFKQ